MRIAHYHAAKRSALALFVMAVVAIPVAGCSGSDHVGMPTAPTTSPSASGGALTALLENAPFTGQDSGTFEYTQDVCAAGSSPIRTHTTGTATLIGAYSFETQECFDTTAFTFAGSFTITAANGDTLVGGYAGHITGFLDEATATYVFTATMTGGTGRFTAATGTISGTGQANLATLQESRTFSGTISRVAPGQS
jgi:hypothetical protein